jgi:hypothetical protein
VFGKVFVFKQKTAYEIGTGDWSSDVCSSDLTILAGHFSGVFGKVFYYLSMNTHFDSITRGVIDTKDLIYFISLTVAGLFLAERTLKSKTS